jgi:glycosyltransferase involved in cell wall biosynthesis
MSQLEQEVRGGPVVSIVTPSYNQGSFIGAAIDSVLSQDYPHVEYMVVDACSTDDTLGVLRSYGDRVRWVSEPDGGQSDGINKGIRLARGEIVAWLNADDVYAPGAVTRAVEVLTAQPEAPAVYGDAIFIDASGVEIRPCSHIEPFDLGRLVNELDYIVQPATFFRRSAWEGAGGLDAGLHYCLDYDLMIRLAKEAPLAYLPAVQAYVRMYPTTKTASGGFGRLQEIERMIRRHGRRTLPRGFQAEMVTESLRLLKRGLTGRRPRDAARGARELSRYLPRLAARRLSSRMPRLRSGSRPQPAPRG